VIWKAHAAEMTDLTEEDQQTLMRFVLLVEKTQRALLQPDKINLAAFGNIVPHLHWHIIARWRDDAHFPQPVWAERPEASPAAKLAQENRRKKTSAQIDSYHQALIAALERVAH
jgi:diadenosine tetraphosphate (Ap4A) HIT family hydrolase